MNVWRMIHEIIFDGLLHGWPGRRCPDCNAKPSAEHADGCPTGEWDSGYWA